MMYLSYVAAPVAELVDAIDSKSIVREDVGVRFPPGAPMIPYVFSLYSSFWMKLRV